MHEIKYVSGVGGQQELVAVSTEDGRVIFYSTSKTRKPDEGDDSSIPYAEPIAQLGGKSQGLPGRVKAFEILSLNGQPGIKDDFAVVTANSEGVVRVWQLLGTQLSEKQSSDANTIQVGKLLNSYETGNRITCMKAFIMMPPEDPTPDDFELFDEESEEEEEEPSSEESDAE